MTTLFVQVRPASGGRVRRGAQRHVRRAGGAAAAPRGGGGHGLALHQGRPHEGGRLCLRDLCAHVSTLVLSISLYLWCLQVLQQ